jgi:hypothetical protein
LTIWEVPVQRTLSNTDLFTDVLNSEGINTILGDNPNRDVNQFLASVSFSRTTRLWAQIFVCHNIKPTFTLRHPAGQSNLSPSGQPASLFLP